MSAVQFLEKKAVIRSFGIALMLAPFINGTLVYLTQKKANPFLFERITFFQLLMTGSPISYLLALGSITLGIIMFQGSPKAWKYVMGLLGIHIIIQLMNLGQNLRQSWLWGLFFVVNASIFVFIADQLVFKLKLPEAKPQQPDPPLKTENIIPLPQKTIKKMPQVQIGFKDYGVWAELVEVTATTIRVRRIKTPPSNIRERQIQFSFKKGVKLNAQFSNQKGSDFYFNFIQVQPDQQNQLEQWIDRHSA